MGAEGFWDDQATAAKVSAEHARVQRRLDEFNALESDIGDLEEMEEMASEDDSIADEVEEQRASIESRLASLEEARLFAGDYDAGDAVVTVNAGAGGTDSQDWAEMLLRMLMRWAETRGMSVELKEASEGEEAGLKSATFIAHGENAYGLYSAEKGVHRLRRPARQQDRLRRSHHPSADGHRRPVPERALADRQQGDGDEDAAWQADRARGAPPRRGDRQGEGRGTGRRLGLADPLVRPAPVHDGQGPPHERGDRQRPGRARRESRRARARRAAAPRRHGGTRRVAGRMSAVDAAVLELIRRAIEEDV